jgi:glyoxylase-like metal-dependent hydrolase (beta-lactamase superfamily II)
VVKIVPIELNSPFPEGTVNTYLVIGNSLSLIDTGNPGQESFKQLKSALHNLGYDVKDIDQIILTHIHVDHIGGVTRLQAEADIPIFVHELAYPSIFGGIQEFQRTESFYIDFLKKSGAVSIQDILQQSYHEKYWQNVTFLKDGDVVPLGGTNFNVFHVPGHSQTDIILWNSETGDAFMGDHLLKPFSVNAFVEPPVPCNIERPKPLLQYRNSLERVSRLPLKTIYPGHGEIYHDHLSLIITRMEEQERRCDQILCILSEREKSIMEISQEMYPRLKGFSIFLGLSQIQGHLDLLESRNQVFAESRGHVLMYHTVSKDIKSTCQC